MGKSSFSLLSSDMKRLQNRFGFALPTVMMVSLIMITLLAAALQFVSSSQSALSRQYYLQLAREAGESGLVYASKCISQNNGAISWTDAKPLKPDTDCSGNTVSGADGYVFKSGLIQTIFTIGFPKTSSDGKAHTINSVGVAQLLRKSDNQVSREYSQTVQAYAGSSAVSTVMSSHLKYIVGVRMSLMFWVKMFLLRRRILPELIFHRHLKEKLLQNLLGARMALHICV